MNPRRALMVPCVVALWGCAPSNRPGVETAGPSVPVERATPSASSLSAGPPSKAERDGHRIGDAYYLGTCPACKGLLGVRGGTVDRVIAGRDLRFCRDECRRGFEGAIESSVEGLDRVMIADQLPRYPSSRSIISGEPLGAHPVDFIVGNRLFRVNTEAERALVRADPARYISALDQAVIEAQRPNYGMPTRCPVQGDILASDEPLDIVVANRMIRVCCARCARVVKARPSQYLSMIDYANREAAERRDPGTGERP